MKIKLVYKLKDGRELSTVEVSPENIHGDGDFLKSLINDKNKNGKIEVSNKEGQKVSTTFSEVQSVEIVFV